MKHLKNKQKRSKFENTPFIFLRNSLTNLIKKQKHAIKVPHTKYRKHLLVPRGLLFGTVGLQPGINPNFYSVL